MRGKKSKPHFHVLEQAGTLRGEGINHGGFTESVTDATHLPLSAAVLHSPFSFHAPTSTLQVQAT